MLGRRSPATPLAEDPLPARTLIALLAALIGLVSAVPPPAAGADDPPPGPHPTAVFGMSTAITGPASSLGIGMRAGVMAAFEEFNADPASKLRLELVVRDDGYDPTRTGKQVRSLIEDSKVLGLVGNVGTPTAVVALPICRDASMPFIGAFTGAKLLRPGRGEKPIPVVFNLRTGYAEEIDEMVEALLDRLGLAIADIGFFTQRDAYGDAGYGCGIDALTRRGGGRAPTPVHARYERNTVRIENALADCLSAARRPKAIIMVGAYAPCAAFIRAAKEMNYTPTFLAVSFVGADALAKELGAAGEGVIVTEVVPTLDSNAAIIPAFKAALLRLPDEVRTQPCLGALEGYAVGRMLAKALAGAPGAVSRADVVRSLEGLGEFDIGLGAATALNASSHDACRAVWPSVIRSGEVRSFAWSELSPQPRALESKDAPPPRP